MDDVYYDKPCIIGHCVYFSFYFTRLQVSLPGSSPGGSREFEAGTALARKDLFIYRYKIRLGRNSVVGKFSGEKMLNNLVYVESQ